MKPRILVSIQYKNRRGLNVCEVHDKQTGKFLSVGIGETQKLAESRAYASPQVRYSAATHNFEQPA